MALNHQQIADIRTQVANIKNNINNIAISTNTFKYVLNQNPDFAEFAKESVFGSEARSKIENMIKNFSENSDFNTQFTILCNGTESFLNNQENLLNQSRL